MATVQTTAAAPQPTTPKRQPKLITQRQRRVRAFMRNKPAVIGAILIAIIVLVAIFAPLVATHDPLAQSVINRFKKPGEAGFLLGSDDKGRDVFSRIIYGTRVALIVGVASVLVGSIIGTAIGMTAAYFGGIVDVVLMRIVDILLSFPDLIMGLLVMAVSPDRVHIPFTDTSVGIPDLLKLVVSIGLTIAPRFARITYGPVLSIKKKEYIEAAHAIGQTTPVIMNRHILPNVAGELVVLGSLWTASAIRLEASLSFIGLGVAPPTPTWGQMIRDGTQRLSDVPTLSLLPGLALLITVFAFNLVGDGLRDVLDPKA